MNELIAMKLPAIVVSFGWMESMPWMQCLLPCHPKDSYALMSAR